MDDYRKFNSGYNTRVNSQQDGASDNSSSSRNSDSSRSGTAAERVKRDTQNAVRDVVKK